MDFLNKAYAQVVELFRSMGPAARITTGLLLAVLVAAVYYLFQYQVSGDGEYLFSGRVFTQTELAEMEAAFAKAGLGGSTIEGNRIRIPRGKKAEYMAALADNGALPVDFANIFDEVFASENALTGSAQLREQKLKNAREKYISMVVSKMVGVEWATVRFDKDESRSLRPKLDARAMVAVKPLGNSNLDADRVQAIRGTVAAVVAGLKPENVTITDLNAGRAFVGTVGGPDGADSAYAVQKTYFENDWRQKIMNQLSVYPGVVVGVDVELDPKLRYDANRFQIDPKQTVALRQRDISKSSVNTEPGPAGRPGAESNGVGNTPQTVSIEQGNKSETKESENEQDVLVSRETVAEQRAPLTPQKVKVSIGVPSSYFEKVWRERNPTEEGAEPKEPDAGQLTTIEAEVKKEIEDAVVNLLPAPPVGGDPYVPVRVTTFTDIPLAAEPTTSMTDEAMSWLAGNWPTLGMSLLGLVSLVMLRGMLRSSASSDTPSPDAAPAVVAAPSEEEDEEEPSEPRHQRTLGVRREGAPTLRDELVEMVKEDPDAAANVLRNWIGDAA
jgi:flagellar M-ring protein FliF